MAIGWSTYSRFLYIEIVKRTMLVHFMTFRKERYRCCAAKMSRLMLFNQPPLAWYTQSAFTKLPRQPQSPFFSVSILLFPSSSAFRSTVLISVLPSARSTS